MFAQQLIKRRIPFAIVTGSLAAAIVASTVVAGQTAYGQTTNS